MIIMIGLYGKIEHVINKDLTINGEWLGRSIFKMLLLPKLRKNIMQPQSTLQWDHYGKWQADSKIQIEDKCSWTDIQFERDDQKNGLSPPDIKFMKL